MQGERGPNMDTYSFVEVQIVVAWSVAGRRRGPYCDWVATRICGCLRDGSARKRSRALANLSPQPIADD
jgi:hypothetical protein